MKNQCLSVLITLFFLLGFSLINAHSLDQDGGEELIILISKTGDIVCSIEIPKKYLDKDGRLLMPFKIDINQDNKQTLSIEESTESYVILPELTGDYTVKLRISDDFIATYIIKE